MKAIRRAALWVLYGMVAFVLVGCCADEEYFCNERGCFYCDGFGCRTAQPPRRDVCLGHFQCPTGYRCTTLGCTEICSDPAQECAGGTTCRSTMWCVGPQEPDPTEKPGFCEKKADCGGDPCASCVGNLCTLTACECDGPEDCDGQTCVVEIGQCREEDGTCQFDYECGSTGRKCVNQRCIEACTAETCPTGQHCDLTKGVCRDNEGTVNECTTNQQCGNGRVCVNNTCFDGCANMPAPACSTTPDSGCGAGRYCASGVCRIDDRTCPFCPATPCTTGHPCVRGVCRTPCDSNEACLRQDAQFSHCDLMEHFCITKKEAGATCKNAQDCVSGDCIDGICR